MKTPVIIGSLLLMVAITVHAQEIFDAVRKGDLEKVKELVENNLQLIKVKGNNDFTPLLFAANNNKGDIAEFLISKGADIDEVFLADYYGNTPITFAIKNGSLKMVKILHEKGANIQYRTNLGENYLHFAAAQNKVDIAEYLIHCGIDINSTKNGGLTPLHIAAITGSSDVVKLLVQKGANLDLKSKDGGTPLHFADAARNDEIAELLRQSGAKDKPRIFPEYKGKYLGQKAPGEVPEPFVPELFRDIYRSYSAPAFSPDGKEVFWYGYFMPGIGYSRIWWMREEGGKWSAPELAPFSDFESWGPAFSHDGQKLYFASRRPLGKKTRTDSDIWYIEKLAGKWSGPKHPGSPPNKEDFNEMLPSPARDGTLYYKAFGPGTEGTLMYKSKFNNGHYEEPQRLDGFFDSDKKDECRDKESIIFFSYGGPRYCEISICFHKPDGRWTRPVYMGDKIHQGQGSSDGKISPDGKYFFFVQNISPYWVDASFIEDLRNQALKKDK